MKEQMLGQRRNEAFSVFASNVADSYRKKNLIRLNAKAITPDTGE
jgi:hypothetical protein